MTADVMSSKSTVVQADSNAVAATTETSPARCGISMQLATQQCADLVTGRVT